MCCVIAIEGEDVTYLEPRTSNRRVSSLRRRVTTYHDGIEYSTPLNIMHVRLILCIGNRSRYNWNENKRGTKSHAFGALMSVRRQPRYCQRGYLFNSSSRAAR